jgi:hypothetical protein
MTLQTELRTSSVCLGDGGADTPQSVAVLGLIHQEPRWCANCGGEQTFVPVYEFEGGRAGYCLGCGEEKIVGFTRSHSQ